MASTNDDDDVLKKQFLEALQLIEAENSDEREPLEQFKNVVVRDVDERSADWERIGLQSIRQGKVAVVMLAGGQGTRLGSNKPKGMFRIGLNSGKSLFELHADRLHALLSLARKSFPCICEQTNCCDCSSLNSILWYIMTSDATDAATRQYFEQNHCFGLSKDSVRFFSQRSQPCLTRDCQTLRIDAQGNIARAPNGNGGVYEALGEHGCIGEMRQRGIENVFVTGVDNVLLRIADPQFIGALVEQRADAAAKVVRKIEPSERVGVLGVRGGRTAVVEYSELSEQDAQRRDPQTGALVYSAANICIHAFAIDFLAEQAQHSGARLPYHLAHKAIAVYDDVANTLNTPAEPNGYKLERFVFDVFPYAKRMLAMYVERDEEFAPLKNAPGATSDTPQACVDAFHALHRRWMRNAGHQNIGDNDPIEVDLRQSYQGEHL